MSEDDQAKAAAIVSQWYWQAAEGHNRKWKYAPKTFTRFYESAPLEADILKLVIEYLRTQANVTGLEVFGKSLSLGDLTWRATDAWFQTQEGDKWDGTESAKVRIYQTLIAHEAAQTGDNADLDGPYTLEDNSEVTVEHTFYWDVEEVPELPEDDENIQHSIIGVVHSRETGLVSCTVEKRTFKPVEAVVEWADDDFEYKRVSFRNRPEPLLPSAGSNDTNEAEDAKWLRDAHSEPNGHGSFIGGYTVRKRKTGTGGAGIKIIEASLDVSYHKVLVPGRWTWAARTTTHGFAWEHRRIATQRFRYVGMTSAEANAKAQDLRDMYTRYVKASVWDSEYSDIYGEFHDVSSGTRRMARIFVYHIEGDVYGVFVDVNEQDVVMRIANESVKTPFLTYPLSGREYDGETERDGMGDSTEDGHDE